MSKVKHIRSFRVLVIEDEKYLQNILQIVLQKQGAEVTVCGDGQKAWDVLTKRFDFDLILLDIMMPGMDGLQLLRKVKENAAVKHIPVMLLTALAQESVVMTGIKLGAKDYVRKPFQPRDLLERIGKLVS